MLREIDHSSTQLSSIKSFSGVAGLRLVLESLLLGETSDFTSEIVQSMVVLPNVHTFKFGLVPSHNERVEKEIVKTLNFAVVYNIISHLPIFKVLR